MNTSRSGLVLFGIIAVAVAAFFLPFWPFAALAAALAGALRRPVLGVFLGAFFDILWGAPGGWMGTVYFPLTLLTLGSFAVRLIADRYLFNHVSLKTLY